MKQPMPDRILDGIKVLDLSRVLAGPWCTQILADFGADVIKIEVPGKGDDTRAWGPPYLKLPDGSNDPLESAYYLSCNRNKRSAAVNLAGKEGAELVRRLAAEADIFVENFRVGGLKKYGLNYETLKAINPRLVYCSITGFGQESPYADRGGYDFVVQGQGGFMSITGEADGGPLRAGVGYGSPCGSPADGARVFGVLARLPGPTGGGQDSHGQQNPQDSGGRIGHHVRAVEAGHGRLRGRRGADQQCGQTCPASAGLASACGPHAQYGRGQPGRGQPRGRRRVPGCCEDETAPG